MRFLSVSVAVVSTAALVQPTTYAMPREIREKAIPATIKVYALNNDLQPVASGSGSIVFLPSAPATFR